MLDHVSYHAVLRYLQRVLGFPVDAWTAEMTHHNEKGKALACCLRAGVTVDAVRQSILSRPVLLAVGLGAGQVIVRYEGFAYVIRDGRVITIVTTEMHKKNRVPREKLLSRSEGRKIIDRSARRNKHRPAGCRS